MRRFWTKKEHEILRKMYADNFTELIAKKLNRSIKSIYSQANMLKLKKSDEYMKIALQREAERLRIVGKKHQFSKGHKPFNLGQKMSKELFEKCKVSMFTSGHEPHNIKYDGYERIDNKDGYIHVRIAKGKFKLKHRLIWEQHYGPIPKGHIIIFKDKNKLNTNIENLMMISMKENMEINRVTKYPLELQQLIKLNNQLKNKLHEKQN